MALSLARSISVDVPVCPTASNVCHSNLLSVIYDRIITITDKKRIKYIGTPPVSLEPFRKIVYASRACSLLSFSSNYQCWAKYFKM